MSPGEQKEKEKKKKKFLPFKNHFSFLATANFPSHLLRFFSAIDLGVTKCKQVLQKDMYCLIPLTI